MGQGLSTEKMRLLLELKDSLTHLMCGGIQDDSSRNAMEAMVKKYIEEEAVNFTERELVVNFSTVEESFKLFFGYLLAKGMVEVAEK
ncbi:hypothetical protein [Desulforhabdus amnigena]|jgi:hypothetical protein|uniref:Uncharacterized protein n=1 Tax=Desulforhabdus amnigena TaxID=40218 RepID=A0A9W6L8S5_9BACT|nr:hypothetical protein [Desulforhabdus amnigena]NLJ27460.1 hypothetical protein [Deltaproteobacteria bacterium]GLI34979.1 hypothetical protein DAMNIGENAA_24120 [Desulforhabdus amnigena]